MESIDNDHIFFQMEINLFDQQDETYKPLKRRDKIMGLMLVSGLVVACAYMAFSDFVPNQIDTKKYESCGDIPEEPILIECLQYLNAKETYDKLKLKWGHIHTVRD